MPSADSTPTTNEKLALLDQYFDELLILWESNPLEALAAKSINDAVVGYRALVGEAGYFTPYKLIRIFQSALRNPSLSIPFKVKIVDHLKLISQLRKRSEASQDAELSNNWLSETLGSSDHLVDPYLVLELQSRNLIPQMARPSIDQLEDLWNRAEERDYHRHLIILKEVKPLVKALEAEDAVTIKTLAIWIARFVVTSGRVMNEEMRINLINVAQELFFPRFWNLVTNVDIEFDRDDLLSNLEYLMTWGGADLQSARIQLIVILDAQQEAIELRRKARGKPRRS